MRKWQWES